MRKDIDFSWQYLTKTSNDYTVYSKITFIVFFAEYASTSIIALMLDLLGYDATLGSMGQMAGVAENLKMFGGFWPMAGCILTFICYKFIYNLTDEDMKKVTEELQRMSKEKEEKALADMNK